MIERRLFGRWFLEVEWFRYGVRVGVERFPSASELVGGLLAAEAESFLEEDERT